MHEPPWSLVQRPPPAQLSPRHAPAMPRQGAAPDPAPLRASEELQTAPHRQDQPRWMGASGARWPPPPARRRIPQRLRRAQPSPQPPFSWERPSTSDLCQIWLKPASERNQTRASPGWAMGGQPPLCPALPGLPRGQAPPPSPTAAARPRSRARHLPAAQEVLGAIFRPGFSFFPPVLAIY